MNPRASDGRDAGGASASSRVIGSILENTAERTQRCLLEMPRGCGLVEIRGDHLRAGELAGLVGASALPVIVTLRTARDGGAFDGSEEERRGALRAVLDAGARYVDVEFDGPLADMGEGSDAARVILSHHGAPCVAAELLALHRRMAACPAAVLKLVPRCESVAEVGAVRVVLEGAGQSRPFVSFAKGRAGAISRLLAPAWGSWATYGSAAPGRETAAGQFTAKDLLDVHDVLGIGSSTRRFALVGRDVFSSPSPAMHRAGYRAAGIDARYLPLELDLLEEILPLLGGGSALGIEAFAVTLPFKEEAARRCTRLDPLARRAGAVNTVVVLGTEWSGFNTDGPAVLELVRGHLDPAGRVVAVVGAGGTARAAAAALHAAGARVTLYNRGLPRARLAAASLGCDAKPLDQLAADGWDVLVQATPLGRRGERVLHADALRGQLVLDAVYGAETPLVADARARGLAAVSGLELLVAQGVLQFERMTGVCPSAPLLRHAACRWLDGRPS